MRYEWDEAKRRANIAKHEVDFAVMRDFDWETALVTVDDREDYGELREVALGFIGVRLHTLVFTMRGDNLVRVIMLRKATAKEVKRYEKAKG
jgi:uncharacterized DUF497 family protein